MANVDAHEVFLFGASALDRTYRTPAKARQGDVAHPWNKDDFAVKIATWNVNSIRARKDRVLAWLEAHQPDVLCVQETKVVDESFPHEALASVGYRAEIHGQKTYNGVALLSREPMTDVVRGFSDGKDDSQARFIGATLGGVRVFSAYCPNGTSLGSDRYLFKLEWMARLKKYLRDHESADAPIALCGDWNVAPDDRDIHDPALWEGELLCTTAERNALQRIVDWGFTDSYRMHVSDGGKFSWWDYRMLGFPKNKGLRIDHIYVTSPLEKVCTTSIIDRDERKGKGASDHAPVVAEFDWS